MYLFQILLPLYHNNNRRIGRSGFSTKEEELTKRYGGVTVYMRAPAEGHWVTKGQKTKDQIITIEVMARQLTLRWWKQYQKNLEARFRQESIVIRYYACGLV